MATSWSLHGGTHLRLSFGHRFINPRYLGLFSGLDGLSLPITPSTMSCMCWTTELKKRVTMQASYSAWRDSTCTKSIGGGALLKTPIDERALRIQWIADQSKEDPRQHRSQPRTTEYSSPHLANKREAKCLTKHLKSKLQPYYYAELKGLKLYFTLHTRQK